MIILLLFELIEIVLCDELIVLQFECFKWLFWYVYDYLFVYCCKFDEVGVYLDDLKMFVDLLCFLFMIKGDLCDSYLFGMFVVLQDQILCIYVLLGMIGKLMVVGYMVVDIDMWVNFVVCLICVVGVCCGDKVYVSYGYGLFMGGFGVYYGVECVGFIVILFGGGQIEKQVQLIQDFWFDIIMVMLSYMLLIVDEIECQGFDFV